MNQSIQITTDGSAIGNPGPGGWAAVFSCGSKRWTLSGGSNWTTAAEMELTAAISALQSLEAGCHVVLKSDCEYLIRGMRYQADRWRRNGWRNSRGVILQDRLLWQQLIGLRKRHTVQWQWVRGHNGHPTQTIADELAYSEARRAWCESRVAA